MKQSDLETYALVAVGAALVTGLAYWAFSQASGETASSSTITSGDQTTTLGPAGSSELGGTAAAAGNQSFSPIFNPSTPFVNAPGPQGPMSGPIPSPGST
jgi:hypothetical protein